METKEVTWAEALSAINVLVMSFIEDGTIDENALSVTKQAVSLDVQFRDYLLGLPYDYGLKHTIAMAQRVLVSEPNGSDFSVVLDTILSAWLFESGDTESALEALGRAKAINPEYGLAGLLTRSFGNPLWSPELFAEMRSEIHPKVIEGIKTMGDEVITSDEKTKNEFIKKQIPE